MMYHKKTIRDNKQAAFSHRWTISVLWTVLLMCCALGVRAQSFTLQGKVSDTNGNPIELASVMVVSQGKLAMTNLKGEFSLEAPQCRQCGRPFLDGWLSHQDARLAPSAWVARPSMVAVRPMDE